MTQLKDPQGQQTASVIPRNAVAVSLASDTTFTEERTLYIGGTGNVKVDMAGTGTGITFYSVPVGSFPYAVTKVYSTANGTTATNITSAY